MLQSLRLDAPQLLAIAAVWTGALALFHLVPERFRKGFLVAASVLLLGLLVPPALALFLVAFAVLLQLAADRGFWPALSLSLALLPLSLSRFFFDFTTGQLSAEDLLGTVLFTLYCRRVVSLLYELRIGRVTRPGLAEVLLYLVGLPFLAGRSPVFSFSEMWESWQPAPGFPWKEGGVRVLVAGLHLVARGVLIAALPRFMLGSTFMTEMVDRPMGHAILALDLFYLRFYLFRFGQEQASIGMARFFGFTLRDNYQNPLMARSYADLWRRWNIHFRELLLGIFYYPVLLRLHRAAPSLKFRNTAIAVALTFFGHFLFVCHSHVMRVAPGERELDVVMALAIYDLCQTALVVSAMWLPRYLPKWLRGRHLIGAALGIAFTFQVRSFLLLFFRGGVDLGLDEILYFLSAFS